MEVMQRQLTMQEAQADASKVRIMAHAMMKLKLNVGAKNWPIMCIR